MVNKYVMRIVNFFALALLLGIPATSIIAQTLDFTNAGYGPFDYTNPKHVREKLPVVEQYHFNSDVENLRGQIGTGSLGGDLMYTIRSFPNHHRALVSVTRLWARDGSTFRPPAGIARNQTPDYLFRRAITFAPADGTVRLLYGIYLLDAGRKGEAIELFNQAAKLAPDTAEINYNLGLMYLRVNEPKKAAYHASKAYEQGHPLPGLRRQLVSAGIWSK